MANETSPEYHLRFKNSHGATICVGLRPDGKCFTLYLQSEYDAEVIRDHGSSRGAGAAKIVQRGEAVSDKTSDLPTRLRASFAEHPFSYDADLKTKAADEIERLRGEDFSDLNAAAVSIIRRCADEGLGFNCTFVDDDMKVIIGLAQRAVLAGLVSDFNADMQKRFAEAAEKRRSDHEESLGREIKS